MMNRLVSLRAERNDDSGAALITALLAILLTATFAIVLLGVLLSQTAPTQLQQATTRTVFAAEAGVNAVVGQIRNAEDVPDATGKIYGDTSQLPCTATGTVDDAVGALEYVVSVQYFTEDPTNQSDAWRSTHALLCSPGAGPSQDPTHAVITSEGTGLTVESAPGDVSRKVEVVYEFQVTNSNVPGGYIYSFDQSITFDRFCLQADGAYVGANVRYIAAADCGTNDNLQLWVYDTDYMIKLAVTTLPTFGSPALCITGTPNGSLAVPVTLTECKSTTDASRWNQLWSWEGGARWRGQQNPISYGYSGYTLNSGSYSSPSVGTLLHVWNQGANNQEWGSYDPDPRVGAGAAGFATHQIVNYLEFGRCADVTHGNPGEPQMITYPCKQDPDPSQSRLNWNHKWYYSEPAGGVGVSAAQQIYVWAWDSTKYCLRSTNSEGGFVTFTTSCSTSDPGQQWYRYGDTGAYDTSYTFHDGYGRCLDLGPWYKQGTSSQEPWSTMVTSSCSSSLGQKWNAPADTISASLVGYWELP